MRKAVNDCMQLEAALQIRDEAIRFNKIQLKRAKVNLYNAEQRGDCKAVANIKRKISIYNYTIEQLSKQEVNGLEVVGS